MALTQTKKVKLTLNVNDKNHRVETFSMARLLDVLREELKLTGSKEGCGEGECGACSVFMNGKLVNSCLVPVTQAAGTKIKTIESLSKNPKKLHPVQTAFLNHGGAQCGICTPGMVMAAVSLLQKNKKPNLEQIREGLAGNLCRCTGYMKIFESVSRTFKKAKKQ